MRVVFNKKVHMALSPTFSVKLSRQIAVVVEQSASNRQIEGQLADVKREVAGIKLDAIEDSLGKCLTKAQVDLALEKCSKVNRTLLQLDDDTECGKTEEMETAIAFTREKLQLVHETISKVRDVAFLRAACPLLEMASSQWAPLQQHPANDDQIQSALASVEKVVCCFAGHCLVDDTIADEARNQLGMRIKNLCPKAKHQTTLTPTHVCPHRL